MWFTKEVIVIYLFIFWYSIESFVQWKGCSLRKQQWKNTSCSSGVSVRWHTTNNTKIIQKYRKMSPLKKMFKQMMSQVLGSV